MKVVAIIQARMSSTRLPGKVMLNVGEHPMLHRVFSRVKLAAKISTAVVATTWNPADQVIVEFCNKLNVPVYRGDEHDVLARYYDGAQLYGADIIVRITADCPLVDPEIIDEMLESFLSNSHYDYMSNTLPPRTFPRGLDVEILNKRSLEYAHTHAVHAHQREHVTPFIYENPDEFTVIRYSSTPDLSNYRLTVDTPDDYFLLQEIYDHFVNYDWYIPWREVVEYLEKHTKLFKLNAHVVQKDLND